MIAKALEIRDRGTFIPALAIEMTASNEGQRYLLRQAGYGATLISLAYLRTNGGPINYDPYGWGGSRTMHVAHIYISKNWATLADGDVVDVEFILGEKAAPSPSDRVEFPDA